MKLSTFVYRSLNRILAKGGVELLPIARDFDGRLNNPNLEAQMVEQIIAKLDKWRSGNTIITATAEVSGEDALAFYHEFLTTPFRGVRGGSRFNNLLSLFYIARSMQPSTIIDSGTYQGASAWALSRGCPQARLYSFDVDLSNLKMRVDGANYVEADWTSFAGAADMPGPILAYFDDHLDQVRRLIEASARHVAVAVFDDDFEVSSFAAMSHGGAALPKLEFALDTRLKTMDTLEWQDRKGSYRWRIDKEYLQSARDLIVETDRLPNTSLITGIHQTPYRVVRLAPHGKR